MSSAPRSLVSVVIPCFNQGRYLRAAIRSVTRQTYAPVELIVVDDGSTDETPAVATQHGAIVIIQRNKGVSEARNAGLEVARGEFVVFLDADDELLPDALALGVTALQAHPSASAVVGHCVPIDERGKVLPHDKPVVDPHQLYVQWLSKNFVWAPAAAMFRRQPLRACGAFPPRLGPAADYAVYLKLARAHAVVYQARDIARYRKHEAGMSQDFVSMLRSVLGVLRDERQFVPHLSADIDRGARAWRAWYGDLMIDDLRAHWREGGLGARHIRSAGALLWYCPERVVREAVRKVASVMRSGRTRRFNVETNSAATGPPREPQL